MTNNLAKAGNAFSLAGETKKRSTLRILLTACWPMLTLIYIIVLGYVEFRIPFNLATIFPAPANAHNPLTGYSDQNNFNMASAITSLWRLATQMLIIAAMICLRPRSQPKSKKVGKVLMYVTITSAALMLFTAPPSAMVHAQDAVYNVNGFNVWADARYGETIPDNTFKDTNVKNDSLIRLSDGTAATYRIIDEKAFLYDANNKTELPVIFKDKGK